MNPITPYTCSFASFLKSVLKPPDTLTPGLSSLSLQTVRLRQSQHPIGPDLGRRDFAHAQG